MLACPPVEMLHMILSTIGDPRAVRREKGAGGTPAHLVEPYGFKGWLIEG